MVSSDTGPPRDGPDEDEAEDQLEDVVDRLDDLQKRLWASDTFAVLCIFQAIDAAGKDSTIRAVTRGINPAGFRVKGFKAPSGEELDHDFLWRTTRWLPDRGRIGIFNRSYYEELLVVRVHPDYLKRQQLPEPIDLDRLWQERYHSIREHERHLVRNGTVVLKFWLNVSKQEQKQRFLDRIHESDKNWKFSPGDIEERAHWDAYQNAFGECLRHTSTPWAPWYAIPADSKPYMRLTVARILEATLESLDLQYPELGSIEKARMRDCERRLLEED